MFTQQRPPRAIHTLGIELRLQRRRRGAKRRQVEAPELFAVIFEPRRDQLLDPIGLTHHRAGQHRRDTHRDERPGDVQQVFDRSTDIALSPAFHSMECVLEHVPGHGCHHHRANGRHEQPPLPLP
ncbi:hypothetical protein PPS11_40213 [Pseudomonas putida S11]|nr:hypothetical protein PPS11_40213 [Pseudomonas putida S11]